MTQALPAQALSPQALPAPAAPVTAEAGRADRDGPGRAARSRSREALEGVLFHLMVAAAVIVCQVAATPARSLNADNTWHFRFARDVMSGTGLYWAAVDANRLFPDLLVSMAAYALPGGDAFTGWKVSFYVLSGLLLYLSLWLLSVPLYAAVRERRAFVVTAVAAFLALALVTPFWDRWLLDPGNHGTALPACFAALAALLWMNRTGRLDPGLILAFIVAAALSVAANRYLLIAFLAPLGAAVLLAWLVERVRARRAAPEARRPWLLLVLAAVVGIAALWGVFGWQMISDLGWHQLTVRGGIPPLPESEYLAWLDTRWNRLASGVAESVKLSWDVVIGLALLAAMILVAGLGLAGALRRGGLSAWEGNRLILVELAGLGAAASLLFLLVQADNAEPFQFRFIAVPVALALVALALGPARLARLVPGYAGAGAAALVLLGLTALTVVESAERQRDVVREEAYIQRGVGQLEARLRALGGSALGGSALGGSNGAPMRGFSEYWIANDVSVRSKVLQVETLEPDQGLKFRFFNNNAAHLCGGGFFYILHDDRKDEPRKAQMLAKLGPPVHSEVVDLARFPRVNLFIYESRVLQERVVDEAKEAAARLFPDFRCGPSPGAAVP